MCVLQNVELGTCVRWYQAGDNPVTRQNLARLVSERDSHTPSHTSRWETRAGAFWSLCLCVAMANATNNHSGLLRVVLSSFHPFEGTANNSSVCKGAANTEGISRVRMVLRVQLPRVSASLPRGSLRYPSWPWSSCLPQRPPFLCSCSLSPPNPHRCTQGGPAMSSAPCPTPTDTSLVRAIPWLNYLQIFFPFWVSQSPKTPQVIKPGGTGRKRPTPWAFGIGLGD